MAARFIDILLRARVVWLVCLLCICLWIAGLVFPAVAEYMALPSSFGQYKHNPTAIITYMFAHTGANHLYFNLLCLVLMGCPLEVYGGRRFMLIVLLAGGVAGGVAYMASSAIMGWQGSLSGISAGVLGVAAALAVMRPHPGIVLAALLMLVLSLPGNTPPEIAAHGSGAVSGAIVALLAGLHREKHPLRHEVAAKAERSGFASLTSAERQLLLNDKEQTESK